jgi:hypothetical protein
MPANSVIPGFVPPAAQQRGPGRLAVTPDLLAGLAARLTARDRWLLRMLWEHRVLTTTQITQLAFGTLRAAATRLLTLYQHQAIDRFRPLALTGSAPWHFVLGPAGAQVLAAEDTISLSQLGYRRDRALAIALSPRLAHTTGTGAFFTALAACARTTSSAGLVRWWSERRCAALWGDLARPDAYGRWHEHTPTGTGETEFFLEYDTGTEDLPPPGRQAPRLPAAGRPHRDHHPGAVLAAQPPAGSRPPHPPGHHRRGHDHPGPGRHRHSRPGRRRLARRGGLAARWLGRAPAAARRARPRLARSRTRTSRAQRPGQRGRPEPGAALVPACPPATAPAPLPRRPPHLLTVAPASPSPGPPQRHRRLLRPGSMQ